MTGVGHPPLVRKNNSISKLKRLSTGLFLDAFYVPLWPEISIWRFAVACNRV